MRSPASLQVHVYGWLLSLPAAVMLATFVNYPTVASVVRSLFLPGTATRPAEFIGLENYAFMLEDDVFLTALLNNFRFAAGTIPLAVGLAVLGAPESRVDWSIINAGTLISVAPLLVAFLLFQRRFVQSFMYAGLK